MSDMSTDPTTPTTRMTAAEAVDYLNVWGEAELKKAVADRSDPARTETTVRVALIADGSLKDTPWEEWRSELLACAEKHGWPRAHVETEAYRAYYDDGYSARDAWDEDMQHAL